MRGPIDGKGIRLLYFSYNDDNQLHQHHLGGNCVEIEFIMQSL